MKYLLHVFLLLLPWHAILADPVVCYSHNAYGHPENCSAYPGCQVITYTGGYFCATKCTADQLQDSTTCNNYAGCKWNSGVNECQPFTENHYRAWDDANQVFVEATCPDEYPNAQPGTDSVHFCYKSCSSGDPGTEECGFYNEPEYWGNVLVCLKPNTGTLVPSDEFHIENTDECRLNERLCKDFEFEPATDFTWTTFSEQIISNGVEISGTAHWVVDSGGSYYDTSECSMIASFRDERAVMQCNTKRLCPTATYTVPSASTHIQYNNGLTSNPAYYYCESCLSAGYYPTTDKPTGEQHHLPTCNNPTSGEHTACSCLPISNGYYGGCLNGWNSSVPLSQCEPSACPAGKTTDNQGSTSSDDCHYTDQTQFCDAKGCFTLSTTELSAWGLTN